MLFSCLLALGSLVAASEAGAFSSASEARTKMEEVVTGYAAFFENRLMSGGAASPDFLSGGSSCPAKNTRAFPQPSGPQFVESCDPDNLYRGAWDSSAAGHTFVNPDTKTCARQLHAPVEGRRCAVNIHEFGINMPNSLTGSGDSYAEFTAASGPRACDEIAATNELVPKFQISHDDYPDLKWNFMGMQETGVYRNWPLIYQCRTESQCTGCSDPRFRSWYAETASGPKDVVLVLDTSGSMQVAGRASAMKEAAKWVINTMSQYDYGSVVAYDSSAVSYSSSLTQMSGGNRASMKEYVESLSIGGGTNFAAGLSKAYTILETSIAAGASSGVCCASGSSTKLILFLTDGIDSGDTDPLQLTTSWTMPGLRVFTYALGSGSVGSAELMSQMACSNGGVYQVIADGGDLKQAMASYFMFLAAGVDLPPVLEKATVSWSDWFEDGQGLGQLAGACVPLYDRLRSTAEVSVLFGVLCTSIAKPTWDSFGDSGSVWAQIESEQKRQCFQLDITEERMQLIRNLMPGAQICSSNDYVTAPNRAATGGASLPDSCYYHEESASQVAVVIGIAVGLACVAGVVYLVLNRLKLKLPCQKQPVSVTPVAASAIASADAKLAARLQAEEVRRAGQSIR